MEPAPKLFPKVSKTSLVDEVIDVMRRMLSEDAWAVGAKLPSEQELGRQLGVGRSTIREALRVLGHLGIVEARSGLGTYVASRSMLATQPDEPNTPERTRQLYEFRRSIEVPAARLAAERRTNACSGGIESTPTRLVCAPDQVADKRQRAPAHTAQRWGAYRAPRKSIWRNTRAAIWSR